jgi:NADH dehydrogenase/NADH:ubiquinone oxidoreductase subunit G
MVIKLVVDGRELQVEQGTVLLEACLGNGIFIPNLCHLQGEEHPNASCRLCFVEVDGKVVPSCTVRVSAPLTVRTDTPEVRALQRSALRLLLSVHEVDCAHCPANKKCALQDIAKFLGMGLKAKGLESFRKQPDVVRDHPHIDYYPNRCVLCGRCVRLCRTSAGRPQMNYAGRGFETVISFYGADTQATPTCEDCQACVKVCPVGALVLKGDC